MTVLVTLKLVITFGELFKIIFKNRILCFSVTTTTLIWTYEEMESDKLLVESYKNFKQELA